MAERASLAGYPAHDWDSIETHFEKLAADSEARVFDCAMTTLVRHLRECEIADAIFPQTSLVTLRLSMTDPVVAGVRTLAISPSGREKPINLTFEETPFPKGKAKFWSHDYQPNELIQAVRRFMVRAGWFPNGHPAILKSEALVT